MIMEDENCTNTAENTTPKAIGKPFVKGDVRINRKGRPKSFDALRELAQQIAHEVARKAGTGEPIIIEGHKATMAEMILRSWAQSNKQELQRAFIEIAFGKVPIPIEVKDWREAAKQAGLNPDEVLSDFERVVIAKMGARASDSRGDTESGADKPVAAPSQDATPKAG
jgi:hypothetical protein